LSVSWRDSDFGCSGSVSNGFGFATCNAVYDLVSNAAGDTLLPLCSAPLPVSDPNCKGGQGLYLSGGSAYLANVISDLNFPDPPATMTYHVIPWPPNDTLVRSDGSKCNAFNLGSAPYAEALICPLGFEDEPSSSSGEVEQSSSSGEEPPDLCLEFPTLPGCNNVGGSSGSGGSETGNCTDLSNCDWAKLDVQLTQLGVEVEIRNKIGDIAGLLQNGYNIAGEQLGALEGIIGAVNSNTGAIGNSARDIVGAINGLADALGNGSGGNGNISGGVADGLGQFAGDTTGQGGLDSLLGDSGFGSGGGAMGDSLGDGSGIRNRIKNSVGIDSASFAFLGTGGDCPVFKTSFDTGIMGIRSDKDINLCDVYGFNAASVLRAMMWLIVIVSCLFMNLHTLKTGGHG
jgi:hypothetical protein